MSETWKKGWQTALRERLKAAGYSSLTDFAEQRPTATFAALAEHLAPAAPIQVEALLRAEAQAGSFFGRFVRSALLRCLRELPNGWDGSAQGAFARACAFSSWSGAVGRGHEQACHRVWDALEAACPPNGWLPEGPEDPIISNAFLEGRFDDEAPPLEGPLFGVTRSGLKVPLAAVQGRSDPEFVRAVVGRMHEKVDINRGEEQLQVGLRDATPGQVALFAIHWCDSEIRNGGFHQLFYNPTGILVPEALSGFKLIGAEEYLGCLGDAVAALEVSEFPRDREVRISVLEAKRHAHWKTAFRPIEERYYAALKDEGRSPARLCRRFVEAHPDEFFATDVTA